MCAIHFLTFVLSVWKMEKKKKPKKKTAYKTNENVRSCPEFVSLYNWTIQRFFDTWFWLIAFIILYEKLDWNAMVEEQQRRMNERKFFCESEIGDCSAV